MPDLVQLDLLAGAAVVARNVAREPALPRPRRKRMAETTRQVGKERAPSQKESDRERCYAAILAAADYGLSRQELADRTGIAIQTVCWTVADLLEAQRVVEPLIGMKGDGSPIHAQRARRKILVASSFAAAWEAGRRSA